MFFRVLLIVLVPLIPGPVAAYDGSASKKAGPFNIEAALQALKISKLAAENDMQELSLRAFREALAGGPPRQAALPPAVARTTGLQSRSRSTATLFNQNNSFRPGVVPQYIPPQRTTASTKRRLQDWEAVALIEEAQRELDLLWRQKQFSAIEVYEALTEAVFPRTRSETIFLYAAAAGKDVNALHSGRSIGARLIEWAERAGKLDDLFRRAADRANSRSKPFSAAVYQAEISLYTGQVESIEQNLDALCQSAGAAFPSAYNEQVLSLALRAMAQGASVQKALPLFDMATDQIVVVTNAARSVRMDSSQVEPASTLLLTSARIRLNHGEREDGLERLETYLNLNRSKNQRYSGKYGNQLRQRQLHTAAELLLATGHADVAIEKLELAAGLSPASYPPQASATTQRLIRFLLTQPVENRYQQLRRLCLPAEEGQAVSLLSGFLPAVATPEPFLSSVGKDDAAKLLRYSHGRLIGTGTLLVDIAAELGKLPELRQEFQALRDNKVANAGAVLALILCRLERPEEAISLIEDQAESVGYDIRTKQKTRDPYTDVMVCVEALRHSETRAAGKRLAQEILRYVPTAGTPYAMEAISGFSVYASAGAADASELPRPARWLSSSTVSIGNMDDGGAAPAWTADGSAVAHHSGAGQDSLYLPFPLTGSFDFVVESSADIQREASVGYGGVLLTTRNSNDSMYVHAVGSHGVENTWKAWSRKNACNETRLRVRNSKADFIVNNRLCFRDVVESSGSPWIFLSCQSGQHGEFHFPRILGEPVIPRKVSLSADPFLRGWTTASLEETRSPALISSRTDPTDAPANPHWEWTDGRIVGRKESSQSGDSLTLADYVAEVLLTKSSGNLLQYDRPLRTGETLSWDFEYVEGEKNVSPVIGRIAFLTEPDGLRLRYLVSAGNWHGISVTNSVAVAGRKDIRLPLQIGWNKAAISLQADSISLKINGQTVYEDAIPDTGSDQFGFYHDSQIHEASIRNVTLTGNWPEVLPDEYRRDLAQSTRLPNDRQTVPLNHSLAGRISHTSPLTVMQHAAGLSVEARYEFLKAWVLPGIRRSTFQVHGAVKVPTPLAGTGADTALSSPDTEPSIVSPALVLIDVAAELNRLPELAEILSTVETQTNEQTRTCLELLALVAVKNGDVPAARDYFRQITSLLQLGRLTELMDRSQSSKAEYWADVILASRALQEPELWRDVRTLLAFAPAGESTASRFRQALLYRAERLINGHQETGNRSLAGWDAVEHTDSRMHGGGLPSAYWSVTDDGTIQHWPGHDRDHLLLSAPVRGDFVFECELTPLGDNAVQLGYNGLALGFSDNAREVFTIPFGRKPRRHRQAASLKLDEWAKCRIVCLDSKLRFEVNGQTVHQTTLTRPADPWIFFRCQGSGKGAIRNVRLTGDYSVPRSFQLDTSVYLHGWSPHYYNESVGSGNPWAGKSDVILATTHPSSGFDVESILQYHRPMREDGTIEYEFFYEPGKTLIHPAIGRLAFLLDDAGGVLLHQLTSERYDRTGLMAENRLAEPQHQLTGKLPLKAGDWNTAALTLQRDDVTLTLNGIDIYRRTLPPHNTRIFGLFHYKDRTGGQVRKVRWTGNWPNRVAESVASD